MNQDIRLHVDFWDHPKTMKLIKELGSRGPEYIQRLWVFAAKYHPTGILEDIEADDIASICRYEGEPDYLVGCLKNLRWIDTDGSPFYSLHNWEKRNPWAARAEERSAIASKAAQTMHMKRKAYIKHACSMHEASEEHAQTLCSEHAPSPSPLPKEKKVKLVVLPEWIDKELWKDFKDNRRALKKPMTELAEHLAIKKLTQLRDEGNDPTEVINQAIERGYSGLFPLPEHKRTFKKFPDKPKPEPWLPDVSGAYPDEKF